ncbi:MAG: pyridoxal phosphate-dependent aminotransferase family protein [Parachlamydiaceae bacterium]|nr:pyridoxal phosphate-dependent aminotransferase family protein [Parachlamydiaceae bacterium]
MLLISTLEKKITKRKNDANYRTLNSANPNLIDFSSNDYLGLSRSTKLHETIQIEYKNLVSKFPSNFLGSTGSRLLTGNTTYVEELEQQIVSFHGYEAGLLFNCGYMANVGLITAVATSSDIIIYDAHVHASTHDGVRLSRAYSYPFRHNDMNHLEHRLKHVPKRTNLFVCIESIYSIDGSIAPLEQICQLCFHYHALLIVDEAHAVGIYGADGEGLISEKKLNQYVFAQVTTFGKALGVYGAIVMGSHSLREYLINFSRPFIYTTALPLHALVAIKCAYQILPNLNKERSHLRSLITHIQTLIKTGFGSQIQFVKVKNNHEAHQLSQYLAKNGFDVRSILSPTVPRGEECLRICLHAFNTIHETNELISLLKEYK